MTAKKTSFSPSYINIPLMKKLSPMLCNPYSILAPYLTNLVLSYLGTSESEFL